MIATPRYVLQKLRSLYAENLHLPAAIARECFLCSEVFAHPMLSPVSHGPSLLVDEDLLLPSDQGSMGLHMLISKFELVDMSGLQNLIEQKQEEIISYFVSFSILISFFL